MTDALVIGAGPAGLMAAEMLVDAGLSVVVAEAKPSVGRKLLMAGKSGLNLTKNETNDIFLSNYHSASDWLASSLAEFGPQQVCTWAQDLDQMIFTGSSGRIFPSAMKASPLLRNWLVRLDQKGVRFHTRWRWVDWIDNTFEFETPDGLQSINPKSTVLALGGASWARLGSDGLWANLLSKRGILLAPFQPSNMGLLLNWSAHMKPHFGAPLKNIAILAGGRQKTGECVISKAGMEGSLIYQFSREIRDGKPIELDLLPDQNVDQVAKKIAKQPAKASLANTLRKALRLDPAKQALVMEFARGTSKSDLATVLKSLPLRHSGAAPLDDAISVAGGVPKSELTDDFMLKLSEGTFCAGEMLDWEAPTGGYLLTACLATGRTAGRGAAQFAKTLPL